MLQLLPVRIVVVVMSGLIHADYIIKHDLWEAKHPTCVMQKVFNSITKLKDEVTLIVLVTRLRDGMQHESSCRE